MWGVSICMDKSYTKIICERAKIETAKWMSIKKYKDKYLYIDSEYNEFIMDDKTLENKVIDYLNFPVFIKPCKQGSSIGVNKVKNKNNLINYLEEAFKYDNKVLIEKAVIGREVECAILGNEELIVSEVGEVLSAEEFYSYSSKYKNNNSKTIIPTNIDSKVIEKIKKSAQKIYKACDCSGLARIDFFIENNTNKIILNEINTLPGFTEISMYPKLIESIGIKYKELLDKLIELAS